MVWKNQVNGDIFIQNQEMVRRGSQKSVKYLANAADALGNNDETLPGSYRMGSGDGKSVRDDRDRRIQALAGLSSPVPIAYWFNPSVKSPARCSSY